MAALFGPVLTHTDNLDTFLRFYRAGRFSAAKVVTGWGRAGGWTPEAIRALTAEVPRLIVRSTYGDPSYAGGARTWPEARGLVAEFAPWVAANPNAWLEVGNEPDVAPHNAGDELPIWLYRWWLDDAHTALRKAYPNAKLIAPAPRVGLPGWERWLEIPADVLRKFDTVSVHLYGWHQIIGDGKGEYAAALPLYERLFPGKSVAVTELGVHDPAKPKTEKLALYRDFARKVPANWRWVTFYHYTERGDLHPEYGLSMEVFNA